MLFALRGLATRSLRSRRLLVAAGSAVGLAAICNAKLQRRPQCHSAPSSSNPWLVGKQEVEAELYGSRRSGGLLELVRSILWNARLLVRFLNLSVRLVPLLLAYPPSCLHESLHELWWRWLVHTIRKGGPSLLKLCQWASTRRDIFSKQFFGRVPHQDEARSVFPWLRAGPLRPLRRTLARLRHQHRAQVHRIWMYCSGGSPKELPSMRRLLRVYKAKISLDAFHKATGIRMKGFENQDELDVAIKVADKGVLRTIDMDLAIFKRVARTLQLIVPALAYVNPVQCLEQFELVLKRQTNLANEAKALTRFGEMFDRNNGRIFFPIVLHASENVLIETFEEGIYVNRLVTGDHDIAAHQVDSVRRRVAVMGARALLKMIFVDNFVHGDLHPGNILIRFNDQAGDGELHTSPTGDDVFSRGWKQVRDFLGYHTTPKISFTDNVDFADEPTLVVLDTGLVIEETPENLRNLRAVFAAILANNGYEAGRLMLTQSPNEQCENPEQFCREVGDIVALARSSTSLRKLHVSQLLSDLFSIVSRHRVSLEPSFTSVVLSVMILEGLGRSLSPDLDLFLCARPYVFSVLRQR
uniref:ABC1 domain-containing protein n=1 Tax=Steinernema glaseri TaxID=37863 RepID=A0A1I8AXJ1_9BILA